MMKRIEKYIAKTVLSAIGLVTLMLIGLQIFILFVGQLDDLGKVDYGIVQAAFYVVLQLPYQVYLFFPMASLLGCLIGLGVLANHSELIVMRAAGVSISQITRAVLKASLLVIIIITALGETIVPVLCRYANDYKTAAVTGGQYLRTAQGLWLRQGNDFISIGMVLPNNEIQNVYQFHFDSQHRLQMAREIGHAEYKNNAWIAYDVHETELQSDSIKASNYTSMPWDVWVKPQILSISAINPDEMTLHQLNRYLREQKRNQQNAHSYQFSFVQRMIQPLTTMVMMVLAIPFIFGPLRSSSMGSKLLVGAAVGFGFHVINRFFGPVSAVFQWNPIGSALSPTLIFALIGLYLMRRVK